VESILIALSIVVALAAGREIVLALTIRNRVVRRLSQFAASPSSVGQEDDMSSTFAAWPGWSLILNPCEEAADRVPLLLKEIADGFGSEAAFFAVRSARRRAEWCLVPQWTYPDGRFAGDARLTLSDDLLEELLTCGSVVLDKAMGDSIPDSVAALGIESAVIAAVRGPKLNALLVICNRRKLVGQTPYQVHYTKRDDELATVIGRVVADEGMLLQAPTTTP